MFRVAQALSIRNLSICTLNKELLMFSNNIGIIVTCICLIYAFDHYLYVSPTRLIMPLSRLKFSAHQLGKETGHYAYSTFILCDKTDIEDMFHFVLVCPSYSQIRLKYIRLYFYKRASVHKIIILMQDKQ